MFSTLSRKVPTFGSECNLANFLANNEILDLNEMKVFADNKIKKKKNQKNEICFMKGRKLCGDKQKMLVTSTFFFSHNVFKRVLSKGH